MLFVTKVSAKCWSFEATSPTAYEVIKYVPRFVMYPYTEK